MVAEGIAVFIGLAAAQALLYRVRASDLRILFLPLFIWYSMVLFFIHAVFLVFQTNGLLFYLYPFLVFFFTLFARAQPRFFPEVRKRFGGVSDFYLISGLWLACAWPSFLGGSVPIGIEAILAFFLTFVLFILASFRERLKLSNLPELVPEPVLFVLSVACVLLAILPLVRLISF